MSETSITTKQKDLLEDMILKQRKFVSRWMDLDDLPNNQDEIQKWALDYISHALEELVELRRCFPQRKYWKKGKDESLDFSKIEDEYADVVHFVINIGLVIGILNSEKFHKVYDAKHQINLERQRNGY